MIADLKTYPEYKESGLPWVGKIPIHWDTKRGKSLFIKMARPVRDGDDVVTCFRDGTVTLRKNRRLRGFTEAIFEFGYQGIRKGDLVIHAMDAFAGAIGVSDSDGKGTPVYAVCQPRAGVISKYYASVVRQMAQSQWILALSRGIRERSTDFRFEMFGGQRLPLPPPSEQTAIVRFLDWANGRLERAIRAKRKVIALLHEQKQAIIHKAVTQGIDPNVPKRDSGIPWLGEIPAHWEVRKLRFLFRYCKGSRAAEITNEYIGQNLGEFPVYSGQTEDGGLMGLIKWHEFDFDSPVVFVSTVGARAMSTRIVQGQFSLSQNCALIIPRSKTTSVAFFEKVFQRLFAYERASISLVMQPSLRFADLNRFYVPLPPHSEQILIIEALSERLAVLDSVIARYEREITLLREYRTRLVADVVTGKLDVREAALSLPEEDIVQAPQDVVDETEEPALEEGED
jgi:type I restriction enzyme S subunit